MTKSTDKELETQQWFYRIYLYSFANTDPIVIILSEKPYKEGFSYFHNTQIVNVIVKQSKISNEIITFPQFKKKLRELGYISFEEANEEKEVESK